MRAGQRSRGRVATVAIDAMTFKLPVFVGDILCVYTDILRIGTSSMKIHVEAWALRRERVEGRVKVTEGLFTFVAIDQNRKTRPVPEE
jgi:acyl-CoA thioesterase YciA